MAGEWKTLKNLRFSFVFCTFWVLGRGGWGILGAVFDDVGSKIAFCFELLAMSAPRWRTREARWRARAPRWANINCKMSHASGKIAISDSTWELLRRSWEHFWSILVPWLESEKHWKTVGFLYFFALLGCLEGVAEASWGLSLAILAQSCLQDRIYLASWGHLGTMLRHVGAKMAIKSAKISQHRRNRALRWARRGAIDAMKGGVGPLKVERNQPQRPRLSNLQLAHCTHYAPKARWRIIVNVYLNVHVCFPYDCSVSFHVYVLYDCLCLLVFLFSVACLHAILILLIPNS